MKENLLCAIGAKDFQPSKFSAEFQKPAFSLVEMLMALLVASLLLAALAPVMTRKFGEDVNVHNVGPKGTEYAKIFQEEGDYEFVIPPQVETINVTSIGGGGAGGGATFGSKTITSDLNEWVVPDGVTKIRVFMVGAGGGGASGGEIKDVYEEEISVGLISQSENTKLDFFTPGEYHLSDYIKTPSVEAPDLPDKCANAGATNWTFKDTSNVIKPGDTLNSSTTNVTLWKVSMCGGGGGGGGAARVQSGGGGASGNYHANLSINIVKPPSDLYVVVGGGGGGGGGVTQAGIAQDGRAGGYDAGGGGGGQGYSKSGKYTTTGKGGNGPGGSTHGGNGGGYNGSSGYLDTFANANYAKGGIGATAGGYKAGNGGNGGRWSGGGGGGGISGRTAWQIAGAGGGGGGGATGIWSDNASGILTMVAGGAGGGGGAANAEDLTGTKYCAGGGGGAGGGASKGTSCGENAGGGGGGGCAWAGTNNGSAGSGGSPSSGGVYGSSGGRCKGVNGKYYGVGGGGGRGTYGSSGATGGCGNGQAAGGTISTVFGSNYCNGGAAGWDGGSSTSNGDRTGQNGKPGAMRLWYKRDGSSTVLTCNYTKTSNSGGGGGAGDIWVGEMTVTPGEKLDFVIGQGGAGAATYGADGADGSSTKIKRNGVVLLDIYGGGGGKYTANTDTASLNNTRGKGGIVWAGANDSVVKSVNWTGVNYLKDARFGGAAKTAAQGGGGGEGGQSIAMNGTILPGGVASGAMAKGNDAPSVNYGAGGSGGGGVTTEGRNPGLGGNGANGYIYIEWGKTNGGGGASGQVINESTIFVMPRDIIEIHVGKGGIAQPILDNPNGAEGQYGQKGEDGTKSYIKNKNDNKISAVAEGGKGGDPGSMTNGKGGNHDESVKHSQKGEDATNIKGGTGGSTEKLLPLLEELTGKGIGIGGCGGSGTPIDSCADGGYANKYQGKHGSFAGAGGGGGGVSTSNNQAFMGGNGADGMVILQFKTIPR